MERSERGSWSWYLLEGKIIDLVRGLMIMGRIGSWSGVGDYRICKHFGVRIRHLGGFKSHLTLISVTVVPVASRVAHSTKYWRHNLRAR